MRFTPKSEQEIERMGLMDEGSYPFKVIAAKDRVSKNGNDMIELQLKTHDREGIIFDYILESMAQKLRHFCEHTGLLDKYESGELQASDCVGKTVYAEIVIQPGQPNPNGGMYGPKNSVKDYIGNHKGTQPSETKNPDEVEKFFNDDIPF